MPELMGLAAFVVLVVVGILIAATRSAKRGRQYLGTEDPIRMYQERGTPFPRVGQATFGWIQRVRMQSQLDGERREDERREAREKRRRDEKNA